MKKAFLKGVLVIDYVTANNSGLMFGSHMISDGRIALQSFMIHFLQHFRVIIDIIVDARFALPLIQAMQSTRILCQCPLPGNRHCQEKSIQTRFVKSLADVFSCRANHQRFIGRRVPQAFHLLRCLSVGFSAGHHQNIVDMLAKEVGQHLYMACSFAEQ